VPHCHSEEEEVFVILDGTATLELWPSPRREAAGEKREELALRPGHLVARPPGTGISHSFLAGPEGVTMLTYGTRRRTTWPGTRARTSSTGAGSE
jgi:uncharacterized cupin superfamily protein